MKLWADKRAPYIMAFLWLLSLGCDLYATVATDRWRWLIYIDWTLFGALTTTTLFYIREQRRGHEAKRRFDAAMVEHGKRWAMFDAEWDAATSLDMESEAGLKSGHPTDLEGNTP